MTNKLNHFQYIKKSLTTLESFFNSNTLSIKELEKARIASFKIEAFGRVLRKGFKRDTEGREFYDEIKNSAKVIEDSIGALIYQKEMLSFSKESSEQALFKKATVDALKAESLFLSKRAHLRENLDILIFSYTIIELFEENLKPLYLKGLINEIKSINKKVKTIDPTLLEDGTHELRRALRWVVMHFIYPDGIFSYNETNISPTRYTTLTPVIAKRAVKIPFWCVRDLSNLIGKLGKVKDEGIFKHYKKGAMGNNNQSSSKIIDITRKTLKELRKKDILKLLRKSVKKVYK